MALFISNAKHFKIDELEKEFTKYGACTLNHKIEYAFVNYDNEKNANIAMQQTNDNIINGIALRVEWSKRSYNKYQISKTTKNANNQ